MRYCGYRTDSIRLDGWDYRRSAWYFLTICALSEAGKCPQGRTHDCTCFFGDMRHGIVGLSRVGCIAHRFWADIPDHFDRARLDAFVIMPNRPPGDSWNAAE